MSRSRGAIPESHGRTFSVPGNAPTEPAAVRMLDRATGSEEASHVHHTVPRPHYRRGDRRTVPGTRPEAGRDPRLGLRTRPHAQRRAARLPGRDRPRWEPGPARLPAPGPVRHLRGYLRAGPTILQHGH